MTNLCWFLLFLNLWLQSEAQGFGINLIKVPDEDRAQTVCTVALLGKYFHSGEALSGSVLYFTITSAAMHVQQSLLGALHSNTNYPWTIVVKDTQRETDTGSRIEHVLHEKPQCYFFVLESMEDDDMDEIFDSWKTNLNWNPLAQFVVYFSAVEETEEEMTDIMIEILLNFMNRKIYNVNIIGQSEESSFYVGKTVFPYHPDNNCGNRVISIETLDLCDYQESEKEDDEDADDDEGDDDEDGDDKEDEEDEDANDGEENESKNGSQEEGENNKKKEANPSHAVLDEDNRDNDLSSSISKETTEPAPSAVISSTTDVEYSDGDGTELNQTSRYTDNASQTEFPKLYIEELYRGLFLDKFPKDLSGCPLVAAYRPWEPYIFNEISDNSLYTASEEAEDKNETSYNNNYSVEEEEEENKDHGDDYMVYNDPQDLEEEISSTSSEIRLNGIEYKMIQTIAERLHISIEMQVENSNLYHLFQQLIDGDIEMVVGGIDEDPSISQFVSSTIPYHQDDLTWCVAKAQHTHNLFNFLATFKVQVWLLTLIFILTASWSIFKSQKCLKLRCGILRSYFSINTYVMGSILGQAVNLKPLPTSVRLSFGTAFVMGFMFSNIYQSFLVSNLTTPKSLYQISHLSEIYENKMHIMGSVDNVRHLNKEGEIYRYVRQQFQMCYNIEECLQRAAKDPKLAVAVSRHHSFYNPRIPRDRLYCFDRNENLYVYLVTMLMPKKFHLLHKINPVIQHVIESGHMQKWARDLDRRRRISEEIKRSREDAFSSLTIAQIGGSFVFNGILLLFALLAFAMEHLVYWLVVKRKTRLKLAKYLHRKFI